MFKLLKNRRVHAVLAAFVSVLVMQPALALVLGGSVPLTPNLVMSLLAGTIVALLQKYVKGS